MIQRTSIYNPTDMNTSEFYNDAKYVGKNCFYKGNSNYQCTYYANARSSELAGKPITYWSGTSTKEQIEKPLFNRYGFDNAKDWLNQTNWETGTEAKIGAIMVYGSSWGSGLGHVRIVEAISGNKITYSAGNESKQMAFKTISKPTISANGFLGYIYNPYVTETSQRIEIKKEDGYEYKWSVDGNRYGDKYDITNMQGFGDTELLKNGWEEVLAVNGSLFYTWESSHYACGLEKSRGTNNQEVEMSCVSDYNTCLSIAGINDELWFASQKYIIDNKLNESYCAITGLGLRLGGANCDASYYKGFESQYNCISGRTIIGEKKDGTIVSISFAGDTGSSGKTGKQCLDLVKDLENAIMLDGGGSVWRRLNGQVDIATSRKVKNALILYRRKKEVTPEPTIDYEKLYNDLVIKYNELEEQNKTLSNKCSELETKLQEAKISLQKIIDKL